MFLILWLHEGASLSLMPCSGNNCIVVIINDSIEHCIFGKGIFFCTALVSQHVPNVRVYDLMASPKQKVECDSTLPFCD